MLQTLYIINKAGGLIFQLDLSSKAPNLTSNDHLRLGSTFHSMHAIANLLSSKNGVHGIEMIETNDFVLKCFQSKTGTKFYVTADPSFRFQLDEYLQYVYQLYVDYVLKNPFYELEMPIRCARFNKHLAESLL